IIGLIIMKRNKFLGNLFTKNRLASVIKRSAYKVEALEPRVLLSGDPVVGSAYVAMMKDAQSAGHEVADVVRMERPQNPVFEGAQVAIGKTDPGENVIDFSLARAQRNAIDSSVTLVVES